MKKLLKTGQSIAMVGMVLAGGALGLRLLVDYFLDPWRAFFTCLACLGVHAFLGWLRKRRLIRKAAANVAATRFSPRSDA